MSRRKQKERGREEMETEAIGVDEEREEEKEWMRSSEELRDIEAEKSSKERWMVPEDGETMSF